MNFVGPSVSVIIPACDRVDMLAQAIDSVLAQTYPAKEIIVADNGYRELDSKLIPHGDQILITYVGKRIGASAARNRGVSLSQSEYVAFLDDDDLWDENFLWFGVNRLVESAADCVFGSKYVFSKDSSPKPYKEVSDSQLNIDTLLLRNPGVGGINLIVSREVFDQAGGFSEHLPRGNDRAFAISVIKTGAVVTSEPRAIALVREHDGDRLRHNKWGMIHWLVNFRRELGWLKFSYLLTRLAISVLFGRSKSSG